MKLLGQTILEKFNRRHPDARSQISAWQREVETAKWQTPSDIKERYTSASFLPDNRVIFNIKGNHYRLDVKISYKRQIVRVVRVGTHDEYSKWRF